MGKKLKNKPLVEALLEFRWKIAPMAPGELPSHYFPIFLGRFHGRLKDRYPYVEPLLSVQIPDELAAHTVKFRFRNGQDGWPLVQTGPGIATLNFTDSYKWEPFRDEAFSVHADLLDAYGDDSKGPQFNTCMLRYINALPADPESIELLQYLSKKFHLKLTLPPGIGDTEIVTGNCRGIQVRAAFPLKSPSGIGSVQLSTG